MKEINTNLARTMLGKTVNHTVFGQGEVTFCTNVAIKVKFADREVSFGFPYAFKKFLSVDDKELQARIEDFYDSGAWMNPIHDHCDGE